VKPLVLENSMNFYGMIKGTKESANSGNVRVNPIVELDVPSGEWGNVEVGIEQYCSAHGVQFIAFYPYVSSDFGRQRYAEYIQRMVAECRPSALGAPLHND
jgi:hypothetical protein